MALNHKLLVRVAFHSHIWTQHSLYLCPWIPLSAGRCSLCYYRKMSKNSEVFLQKSCFQCWSCFQTLHCNIDFQCCQELYGQYNRHIMLTFHVYSNSMLPSWKKDHIPNLHPYLATPVSSCPLYRIVMSAQVQLLPLHIRTVISS